MNEPYIKKKGYTYPQIKEKIKSLSDMDNTNLASKIIKEPSQLDSKRNYESNSVTSIPTSLLSLQNSSSDIHQNNIQYKPVYPHIPSLPQGLIHEFTPSAPPIKLISEPKKEINKELAEEKEELQSLNQRLERLEKYTKNKKLKSQNKNNNDENNNDSAYDDQINEIIIKSGDNGIINKEIKKTKLKPLKWHNSLESYFEQLNQSKAIYEIKNHELYDDLCHHHSKIPSNSLKENSTSISITDSATKPSLKEKNNEEKNSSPNQSENQKDSIVCFSCDDDEEKLLTSHDDTLIPNNSSNTSQTLKGYDCRDNKPHDNDDKNNQNQEELKKENIKISLEKNKKLRDKLENGIEETKFQFMIAVTQINIIKEQLDILNIKY